MATAPAEAQGPSDGELIEAVRNGSTDAYAQLYERHVNAAYNMARQVAKSTAETDDLVSEAFAKVLDTLRSGRGPTTAFRAYLLTALRNTAYDRTRRDKKLQLAPDVTEVSGADVGVPFTDTAVAGLERTLAAQAFARLPERWQTVLWHVEIEGQSPSEVAPLLGLTANGVSALAYRAREGLRQAYLQVHLVQLDNGPGVEQCRATMDRLGAWTRSGLSKRETAQVEAHLDGCDRCRALAAELAEVNGALHVIIGPLVLGAGAAGYLALSGSAGAGTAAAAGSTAAGGAAAVSAAPRQTMTSGFSAAALVAVVALGLAADSEPPKPVAAEQPPPPPVQPPPTAPQPPAPPKPKPKPPKPPAEVPPPPPPPGTANLAATGPSAPIRLIAGGDPASLPITIRNSGTAPSEPVTTALSLPPGVSATVPGAASSGPASTSPQSASTHGFRTQVQGPPVTCDQSPGGIRCTGDRGLAPGEALVIGFLVSADETARGGDIRATVSAGQTIDLRLQTVPVLVAPGLVDGVDVTATGWDEVPWLPSRVRIGVRNTGTSSGRAEAVAELPPGVSANGLPTECELLSVDRQIRCAAELDPGEQFEGVVWLSPLPGWPGWPEWPDHPFHELYPDRIHHQITVPVTARLGTAGDQDTAEVRLWFPLPPDDEPDPVPPDPTTEPTTSPPDCPTWWWPLPSTADHDRPCWEEPWLPPSSSTVPSTTPPPSTSTAPPSSSTAPPTTGTPTTTSGSLLPPGRDHFRPKPTR